MAGGSVGVLALFFNYSLLTEYSGRPCRDSQFKLKKVDCALFLTPHPPFRAKIERRLMALPDKDRSINQTNADFIKDLPLIASFELKRQALGTDPLVQLGIWSAALAERLGRLQGRGEEERALMAMPVVSIVGHDWKIYYSYTTEEGERVRFKFFMFKSTAAHDARCKC